MTDKLFKLFKEYRIQLTLNKYKRSNISYNKITKSYKISFSILSDRFYGRTFNKERVK